VRIVHILGDSKYGGAAKSIIRLAKRWETVGWEARILTTDPQLQEAASANGVETVSVDCIWREIRPIKDLIGLYRLWRYLRAERFTVAHTHTTKAGFIGRLAARLAGVPVVIHTVHGFAFHERSPKLKIAFYSVLETIAGWCCHRIITVSQFHRDWAIRLRIASPDKILAIPNGIPDATVPSGRSTSTLRNSLGISPNEILVFTPGRIAEEKGLEELLACISELPEIIRSHARFVIAGDGPLLDELKQRATELDVSRNVSFLGFRSDIGALLAASDIVVLPTWREGLSIALLESMCAGRAIVATTIGSNLEALGAIEDDGPAGLCFDPGDVPRLAAAISRLATNPQLRAHMGRRARSLWELHYTADRTLSTHEHTYLDLLERRGCMPSLSTAIDAGRPR